MIFLRGILARTKFYRAVADEAQFIRNRYIFWHPVEELHIHPYPQGYALECHSGLYQSKIQMDAYRNTCH
jgi:hypothetical protein